MHPMLVPAARRVWRDTTTLQLGLPTAPGLLLAGVDDGVRRLLPLLDGLRTREDILREARAQGCADPEAVLDLLGEHGLIVDADALRGVRLSRDDQDRLAPEVATLALIRGAAAPQALLARRDAHVLVLGAGRVGAPLAALLSAAGVGTVDVRDPSPTRLQDTTVGGLEPDDLGRRRDEACAARLRSRADAGPPDLVILADDAAGEPPQPVSVLTRDGIPHLRVRVEANLGEVGPLVLPGRTTCLQCLDLVRSAIDPAWAAMCAQPDTRPPSALGCDGVLAAAVAAQACLQALQLLEGDEPASVGGTLELELPGWQWRRRSWPRHPACPCAAVAPTSLSAAG